MKQGKQKKEQSMAKDQNKQTYQALSEIVIDIGNLNEIFESDSNLVLSAIQSKLEKVNDDADQLRIFKLYFEGDSAQNPKKLNLPSKANKIEDLTIDCSEHTEWVDHNIFEFISRQLELKNLKLIVYNDDGSEKILTKGFKLLTIAIPAMTKLESLHIDIFQTDQNYLKDLTESLSKLKNLKSLTITFNSAKGIVEGFEDLTKYIRQSNKELKFLHLTFEECDSLPDKQTKQLLESISSNKNIQDLTFSISGCIEIYKKLAQDLCDFIPNLTNLQKLSLGISCSEFKPAQLKQILESLQTLKNLTSLKIDINSTSTTPESIANLLKYHTNLTSLELNLSHIQIKGKFQLISQSLQQLTKLTHLKLDLTQTEIGSQKKGCEQLFDFLANMRLDYLNLDFRNEEFYDKFLVILCKQIGKCSSLQALNLQLGCYDQEENIPEEMMKALYELKNLKSLVICDGLGTQLDNSFRKNFNYLVDFLMQY